jgi:NAD-dependent deacetylase
MAATEVRWGEYKNIVVLTGAGISVASGLRPYRGPGGLWSEIDADSVVTAAALERDPARVWAFFAEARRSIEAAAPNAAHVALARLARQRGPGQSLVIVTQNIDGLHQRAGSAGVIELHGSLRRARCSRADCEFVTEAAAVGAMDCPRCGAALRPDVVLFDEAIPAEAEWHCKRALRDCDLFVAVGTSGTVTPAASFVRSAQYAGARTILINLEAMTPRNPYFAEEILGRAEEVLPALVPG